MFAIVSNNGKQYRFEEGKEYKIDLIESEDKTVVMSDVLLVDDGKEVKVGTPTVKDATVELSILGQGKYDKIRVFKFKSKSKYERTQGHRQDYSVVKVNSIKC